MKKIFLILIANFCLGANLMQYDLFNHDDSVDIALAFDSAYKPDIVRRVDGQSMSLILKGLGGDEKFNEMRTNQKVLKSFTIAPKGKDIEINFPTGADLSVDALTQDGNLKLILRVKNPAFDQSKMSVKSEANETAQSSSSGVSVMPIIVALLLAAAAFVGGRKFLLHKPQKSIDETWRVFEDDASIEGADVDEAGIDEIFNEKKQEALGAVTAEAARQKLKERLAGFRHERDLHVWQSGLDDAIDEIVVKDNPKTPINMVQVGFLNALLAKKASEILSADVQSGGIIITKKHLSHAAPKRKEGYDHALRIEEMRDIVSVLDDKNNAYVDLRKKHKNILFIFEDKKDGSKINLIPIEISKIIKKFKQSNYVITLDKNDKKTIEDLIEKGEIKKIK